MAAVAGGFADGTFRPHLSVSRGHFAKMAITGLHLDAGEPATPTFSDVAATDDLFPWVEGAVAAGIISGLPDGTFSPGTPVTRQQAYSILGLYLSGAESTMTGHIAGTHGGYASLAAWYEAEGVEVLDRFFDSTNVASDHAAATAYLVHRGVVQGSSRSGGLCLDPTASLTRAQAVVLILRVGQVELLPPRTMGPFVTTDWLQANFATEGLVVIDLRSAADYALGHIPGSVSVPFGADSAWAKPNALTLELPPQTDLFTTIGACGITTGSPVVLVGGDTQTTPPSPLIDATRVAATLIHAGIGNVGILRGGYQQWVAAGGATTTEAPSARPVQYGGAAVRPVFVSTEYVHERIGTATIVDTRSTDAYFGITVDAAAPKAGHIATAVSLPMQWAWQPDGAYISADRAGAIAAGVIGPDKSREIIVYCTYGGTASVWWFLLSQVLGYRDVKLYDGSAQAWVKDHDMVAFTWSR
ncbi:MAG: S-layer homology domain-containing protein [Thermoleophilia bacterium]|nr:S-layer homology domain-containing protein [Thermoleophilia bacterium]